jgi:hypothetical protein
MGTYLAPSNYKVLPVFMSAEMQNSSTRQDDKFNVQENKSTKDIFYPFILPLNKLHNGFWIDKNTKDIDFNAEDAPKTVESFYSEDKWKANILLVVQNFKRDTVVDVKQYIRLKTMLQEENAESGITNPSEKIVESLYSENKRKANILLNELFLKNFYAPHIIVGILHIISHFDYDLVSPEGPTMAIAALTHKDVEVREYGVKCFENWQHKDGIRILEHIKADERWLQHYINLVIRDLENL